jgi:nitroreductase
MPQKSLERRAKLAKRSGTTATVKHADIGVDEGMSRHATKKSRHVAVEVAPPDRHASRHAAPGEGGRSTPGRSAMEARQLYRSEAGGGRRPGHRRKEER